MNRTVKWLYAALLCILLGAGLIFAVGAKLGWDFERLGSSVELKAERFPVEESFRAIDLRGCGGDVTLLPSLDGDCLVVAGVSDADGVGTKVEVRDGTLYITREDTRPWYEHVSFWTGEEDVTVFLPAREPISLELDASASRVRVESGLVFERASFRSLSGDIVFLADAEALSVETGSGTILVDNCRCGEVSLRCGSGGIRVRELLCESLESRSTSGDQVLERVVASGGVTALSSSGEQRLVSVDAGGALSLESSSGDIEFERINGESVSIRASSGSVEGTAARRMAFRASSGSGDVSVPEGDAAGGAFTVSTTSGDIRIRLA